MGAERAIGLDDAQRLTATREAIRQFKNKLALANPRHGKAKLLGDRVAISDYPDHARPYLHTMEEYLDQPMLTLAQTVR